MRSILALLLIFISFQAFGQKDYDKRLLVKYSDAQIKSLQTKHPSLLDFMSFYLDNGFEILDGNSPKSHELAGEVTLPHIRKSPINIFALGIPLPLDQTQFYAIKNSDKVLVLHSRRSMIHKFNRTAQ